MRQLALDLGHRKAVAREDFLLAPCNAEAVAWIDCWPDWPAGGLAVYGPPGCGKTHLAHVWQTRAGARFTDLADLAGAIDTSVPLILDDADRGLDEVALLHAYNRFRTAGRTVLLTGTTPPARWPVALPDLRSRLAALPVVAVGAPDDALLAGVLVKHFNDRQLAVLPEVVAYLTARIERSFEALREAVEALDHAALAQGRTVTVPLARAVLAGLAGVRS